MLEAAVSASHEFKDEGVNTLPTISAGETTLGGLLLSPLQELLWLIEGNMWRNQRRCHDHHCCL